MLARNVLGVMSVVLAFGMGTPSANAELLVSVDFQGAAGTGMAHAPTNQTGNESLASTASSLFTSAGTTWNYLEVGQCGTGGTVTTNPSFNGLVDRGTGLGTGVGFSLTGTTFTYNILDADNTYGAGAVTRDYWVFSEDYSGIWGVSSTASWQITGLTPGAKYSLYLYGSGADNGRPTYQTIDMDGDGLLTNNAEVQVGNSVNTGALFSSVVANGYGKILGSLRASGVESDWSGFQIAQETPEPGTMVLMLLGIFGLSAYAWKKRK
jgi:hypothetical protein